MKITKILNLIFYFFFFLIQGKKKFIFYSEGLFYTKYYLDLAKKINEKFKIIVITSDLDEKNFLKELGLLSFYIGNGELRKYILNNISCTYLILTLTDIGINFKRSLKVKKYIYYFHSLASMHKVYKKDAFNSYDIFLVNGQYHVNEIEKMEQIFKIEKKEIVKTGYFYLKYLKNNANLTLKKKNQILFAPSWNYKEKNLFNDYSIKIIETLLSRNFRVLFRPHFENIKRNKKIIRLIKEKFGKNENFKFDNNSDNLHAMEKSELLITDNSLIATEFTLIFKRLSLFINYEEKIHNLIFKDYELKTFEDTFKEKLGKSIQVNQINLLGEICKQKYDHSCLEKAVKKFSSEFIYDYDKSIEIASNYIISLD
mgnify:FL=1